jgi:hypothetical protein
MRAHRTGVGEGQSVFMGLLPRNVHSRVSAFGQKWTFGADNHHAAKGPYDPAALNRGTEIANRHQFRHSG